MSIEEAVRTLATSGAVVRAPRRSDWLFRLVLAVACAAIGLAGNGSTSVFDRDEARFALAVSEMDRSGDFVVPTNFGEPRYNKPILVYWLALGSEKLFGVGDWAVRLPSAVCGVVVVLLAMSIARRLRGERVARIAGGMLATALFFVVESKVMTADALLLLSTTASMLAWMRLREAGAKAWPWQLLLWVSVGVGLLAKVVNVAFLLVALCAWLVLDRPPSRRAARWLLAGVAVGSVAVAIPGLGLVGPLVLGAIVAWTLVRALADPDQRRAWSRSGWTFGAPLALATFAAWAVPAVLQTGGGFLVEGAGHHLLARAVTSFEGHSGLPGYYLVTTLVAFFPWGALLPAALRLAVKERRVDPNVRFLLAWVIGPLVLVEMVSSKLPHYMLVSFPALAILAATMWEARREAPASRRWRLLEAAVFALPCVAVAVVGGVLASRFGGPIRAASLGLAAMAIAYAVAGVVSLSARAIPGRLAILFVGAVGLYLVAFGVFLPALEPLRLAPAVSRAVESKAKPDERIILAKLSEASLGRYLPRTVESIGKSRDLLATLLPEKSAVLVLSPGNDDRQIVDSVRNRDRAKWKHIATVHGVNLPSLTEREVWIWRRHPMPLR